MLKSGYTIGSFHILRRHVCSNNMCAPSKMCAPMTYCVSLQKSAPKIRSQACLRREFNQRKVQACSNSLHETVFDGQIYCRVSKISRHRRGLPCFYVVKFFGYDTDVYLLLRFNIPRKYLRIKSQIHWVTLGVVCESIWFILSVHKYRTAIYRRRFPPHSSKSAQAFVRCILKHFR